MTKKASKKESQDIKPIAKVMQPKPINIVDVVKQAMVQLKYEEIGSWLTAHRTPLFYAHKEGFSVVDLKFIESHPKLKKELENLVAEIQKKPITPTKAADADKKGAEYIG